MKDLYCIVIFVLLTLCSCKKQNEISTLPMDKLYILEYNYGLTEASDSCYFKFYIAGFCELDKDFKRRFFPFRESFYNIEDIVPDSMRNKISNVLLRYQTDTTFLYQGKGRIYDGNRYRFIMQKHNQKDIIIKFEPKFLPEDLMLVYSYLYGDREEEKELHRNRNKELFEMFKSQVKNEELELPKFRRTIKFTAPVYKK